MIKLGEKGGRRKGRKQSKEWIDIMVFNDFKDLIEEFKDALYICK